MEAQVFKLTEKVALIEASLQNIAVNLKQINERLAQLENK